MKLWQWVLSTLIAGVTMSVGFVTFVSGLVYTKTEGKALEQRVDRVERKSIEDEAHQREDIAHMRDTIDEIYQILIRARK